MGLMLFGIATVWAAAPSSTVGAAGLGGVQEGSGPAVTAALGSATLDTVVAARWKVCGTMLLVAATSLIGRWRKAGSCSGCPLRFAAARIRLSFLRSAVATLEGLSKGRVFNILDARLDTRGLASRRLS